MYTFTPTTNNNKPSHMTTLLRVIEIFLVSYEAHSFQGSRTHEPRFFSSLHHRQSDSDTILSSPGLAEAASKFKVVTCMSTSCSKKRKDLGLDSLSTFGAFYSRSKGERENLSIAVEEGPCMGACKMAPCVAVEHDDFLGSVALEGMTDQEFADRV
jgi:Thioredoxin-like [2Fe-2S] ferredoxin